MQFSWFLAVLDHYSRLRCSHYSKDSWNLINLTFARKQRILSIKLEQNTSYTPNIHLLGVVPFRKQALWGSIPPCWYVLCIWLRRMYILFRVRLLLHEPKSANFISRSAETKIFYGFRSLWKIPFSWMNAVASRISWPTARIFYRLNSDLLFLYI